MHLAEAERVFGEGGPAACLQPRRVLRGQFRFLAFSSSEDRSDGTSPFADARGQNRFVSS